MALQDEYSKRTRQARVSTTALRVCGCGRVAHKDAMSLDRVLGWLCDPCSGVNPAALTLAGAEAAGRAAYLADTR
jgi:hypothetical protein